MNTSTRQDDRRKLPNGFGQITMLKKENLKNPFRVIVHAGRDEGGKPIYKPLQPQAYFPTYDAAYAALSAYNRSWLIPDRSITVRELYELWLPEFSKKRKHVRDVTWAWKYCGELYDLRLTELRARHIKACMERGTARFGTELRPTSAEAKNRIKMLFDLMLDFALEYELVDSNYARAFRLSPETVAALHSIKKERTVFSAEEIDRLWSAAETTPGADLLLIQCYGGWRPQELGLIELANVDLERWTIIGGMKTAAGKHRLVPIHPRIRELVRRRYQEALRLNSNYLLNWPRTRYRGTQVNLFLSYPWYRSVFGRVRDALNLAPSHQPHDCRAYFITAAKRAGVDEYAIKYMVGHSINDLTERVYTKREPAWLETELAKIP